MDGHIFNPPPGWPKPPMNWKPPVNWTPDPHWPEPPPGWQLWIPDPASATPAIDLLSPPTAPAADTPTPTSPASADVVVEAPFPPPPVARSPSTAAAEPAELVTLRARVAELEGELARVRARADGGDLVVLDDERILQEVGIYRYHHPLETADAYKYRLAELDRRIAEKVTLGQAILANDMFTFNNSLAKGRKMVADLSKLMLRAYNAEADNCVRSLRAGNVVTAKKRLEAAVNSIARLGALMEMRVDPDFHELRIEEIELTADFLIKVQEERNRAREEREQLREQRRVEAELAAERERLDKERAHYANALEALRAAGDDAGVAELEARLVAVDQAIAENDYRTANIRAGYVYVISNPGAFGPDIVKIGMTRRLEPHERVVELGDASVPFPFEVHAMYFSEDAVTLENELHKEFAHRKVNWVNDRREFFFATPDEVRQVLVTKVGNLLEYVDEPEATQYLQSRSYWPATVRSGPA